MGMAVSVDERDRLLTFLDVVVNGVSRESNEFPGVTDTSSNLGVVKFENGKFRATFKVRSLQDGRADALADKLDAGLGVQPGYTPSFQAGNR